MYSSKGCNKTNQRKIFEEIPERYRQIAQEVAVEIAGLKHPALKETVEKDLEGIMACLHKATTTVANAVTNFLAKPDIKALLNRPVAVKVAGVELEIFSIDGFSDNECEEDLVEAEISNSVRTMVIDTMAKDAIQQLKELPIAPETKDPAINLLLKLIRSDDTPATLFGKLDIETKHKLVCMSKAVQAKNRPRLNLDELLEDNFYRV